MREGRRGNQLKVNEDRSKSLPGRHPVGTYDRRRWHYSGLWGGNPKAPGAGIVVGLSVHPQDIQRDLSTQNPPSLVGNIRLVLTRNITVQFLKVSRQLDTGMIYSHSQCIVS